MSDQLTISRADAVRLLNEALQCDRDAMTRLVLFRTSCNKALADHPTIQVRADPTPLVGTLGLLNGLFPDNVIKAVFNQWPNGKLTRFE